MTKKQLRMHNEIAKILNSLLRGYIPSIIMAIFGMVPYSKTSVSEEFLLYGIFIPAFLLYASIVFSIIIHELGHLIMGLKNKMIFEEFNFLIFSVVKEKDKLKLKIRRLVSSSGFCLMDLPDNLQVSDYRKFCLGGIIANIILIMVGFILLILSNSNNTLKLISLYLISFNVGEVIINIIPWEPKSISESDGMKLYRMRNDKNYINDMKRLQKIVELMKKGILVENIPDSLIYEPKQFNTKTDIYLMDIFLDKLRALKKYEEAEKLVNKCLSDNDLSVNERNIFKLHLIDIYFETNRIELLKDLFDNDLYKFICMLAKFDKSHELNLLLYHLTYDNTNNVKKISDELKKYYGEDKVNTYINKFKK